MKQLRNEYVDTDDTYRQQRVPVLVQARMSKQAQPLQPSEKSIPVQLRQLWRRRKKQLLLTYLEIP